MLTDRGEDHRCITSTSPIFSTIFRLHCFNQTPILQILLKKCGFKSQQVYELLKLILILRRKILYWWQSWLNSIDTIKWWNQEILINKFFAVNIRDKLPRRKRRSILLHCWEQSSCSQFRQFHLVTIYQVWLVYYQSWILLNERA